LNIFHTLNFQRLFSFIGTGHTYPERRYPAGAGSWTCK